MFSANTTEAVTAAKGRIAAAQIAVTRCWAQQHLDRFRRFFSRLTVVTGTRTDYVAPSVAIGRIYALYAMRPETKITSFNNHMPFSVILYVIGGKLLRLITTSSDIGSE